MTEEIRRLISTCYVHIRQVETFLELDQPTKSELHSRELEANAHHLVKALYYLQRRSGEVAKP